MDKYTENLDVRLVLWLGSRELAIWINGQCEKRIEDRSLTKDKLARKPIKYVTRFQRYLSIWFDLTADHLMMKFNGVNVLKLPAPELSPEIHRHKIVDTTTADQR